MNKFIVPIGLPGLAAVRRKRLLPLRHNGRADRVHRAFPLRRSRRALGVQCPGIADHDGHAVECVRTLQYPNVAIELADYRRPDDAVGECIVNPVDTPLPCLGIESADSYSNKVFPVAGLPVINVTDASRQRAPLITSD